MEGSLLKRIALLTALTLGFTTPAFAHDFWLQPSDMHLKAPGAVDLKFLIGHDDEITPWVLRWDRVVSLNAHGPNGAQSLQASLVPSVKRGHGSANADLSAPGSHIIAMASYHSDIEIKAADFNRYATKEGLSQILTDRKARGREKKPGTEIYSRRAKVIVQVGSDYTQNVLEPIGHTLEIVPKVNPASLAAGEALPFEVHFRGKPLAGALVDLALLDKSTEPQAQQTTKTDGRASFTIPEVGTWKLNVVWGWPNPGNKTADYETIFTSLVFSNAR